MTDSTITKIADRLRGQDISVMTVEDIVTFVFKEAREPSAAMRAAVFKIGGSQWVAYANAVWPTLVDAILKEHEATR